MNTESRQDWIDDLFVRAQDLPAEERQAFLIAACSDAGVAAEVQKLLVAHEKAEQSTDLFATPPIEQRLIQNANSQHHPLIGQRVGPYEVIRWLGGGGFGHVYLGFRGDDYKQKVAIKVLRSDIEVDDRILARFELERQLLADLQHEHIARLLYGGTLDTGRPYIVMEYVKGRPITEYCDVKKLTIAERLAVFRQVCEAVAFAHRFGAIHRDIKPGNIFVDEDGNAKLLDFGIAKMVDPVSQRRMVTLSEGGMPLTPEYASPEQIRGARGEGISTASDVYSLGIVLYELLTGRRPYSMRECSFVECERIICEQEPRKPSTVVLEPVRIRRDDGTDDMRSAETFAEPRSTDPHKLHRELRGDLEQIVLMALRKESRRRYQSVEALLQDLDRYDRGQTISARPIGRIERAYRLARRKPMTATTIALVLLLATAGPTVAVREVHLRELLKQRFAERNNLMSEKEQEMRLAASTISELERKLDVWEGRANPWEFWPPKPTTSLRENIVADLLKHSKIELLAQLRSGKRNCEETTRGYFALAIMSDAVNHKSEAREYYESARKGLIALKSDYPQQRQFAVALADCNMSLARLLSDNDRHEAEINLRNAKSILHELAIMHDSGPKEQIDWLESEWTFATQVGFEAGQDSLTRTSQIKEALSHNWPNDIESIYRLACSLLWHNAILTAGAPAIEKSIESKQTSNPNDRPHDRQ